MIALGLGSAARVWGDVLNAATILGGLPEIIVACNDVGAMYSGEVAAFVTHHPDQVPRWLEARRLRGLTEPGRIVIPNPHPACPDAEVLPVRWDGSSGLYTAQVALELLGASGVVLCGVPLDEHEPHLANGGPWSLAKTYRSGFREALPEVGGRIRSMSGWTRSVLGAPTADWKTALTFKIEDFAHVQGS